MRFLNFTVMSSEEFSSEEFFKSSAAPIHHTNFWREKVTMKRVKHNITRRNRITVAGALKNFFMFRKLVFYCNGCKSGLEDSHLNHLFWSESGHFIVTIPTLFFRKKRKKELPYFQKKKHTYLFFCTYTEK